MDGTNKELEAYVWDGHQGYDNGVEGWHSGPNSAGGVSVKGEFKYSGAKTIKYIILKFTPYNRVGDAVGCTVKDVSEMRLQCTGPYEPGKSYGFFGENMWYNHGIYIVRVTGAEIRFMDGTEKTFSYSEIGHLTPTATGGCYVATAVYGSYDCPEVWTLRRYRDFCLASTWYGRAFIHTYYALSPTIVKLFGKTKWFKNIWKGRLDKMVKQLQEEGYDSTPYNDCSW